MNLRRIIHVTLRAMGAALGVAVAAFVTIILRTAADPCLPMAANGPVQQVNTASNGTVFAVSHALSPFFGDLVGRIRWRKGALAGSQTANAALTGELQPFDVLLQKNGQALSDRFIPGYFTHALIYLGNEAQLRAAGLWDLPVLAGVHDALQAGRQFVEVDRTGSHLVDISEVINTDELVVLRVPPPAAGAAAWPATMLQRLVASLGRPYDFSFDADTAAETTCAELVLRSFDHIAWPLRDIMNRRAILPDDILRVALAGQTGVTLIAFHTPGGNEPAAAGDRLAQCRG